jgi:chemotaxis protein CheD
MSGSPTIASLFAQRVVIGVGDHAVSNHQATILSTYALGSCIGVVVYDPVARCGGILHLMLPEASVSPQKAASQPAMFADTGLPLLFRELAGLKAERARVKVFVAGGASVIGGQDPFKIGERNTRATLDFLNSHRVPITQVDTGGSHSRTVHLELSTGKVQLITPSGKSAIALAA